MAHLSRSKGVIRGKRKAPASGDQGYNHVLWQGGSDAFHLAGQHRHSGRSRSMSAIAWLRQR